MNTPSKNPPVVLITGALTGIGRATAIAFAHAGAQEALGDEPLVGGPGSQGTGPRPSVGAPR